MVSRITWIIAALAAGLILLLSGVKHWRSSYQQAPQQWVVCPVGCAFQKIQDAIEAAPEGATIQVRAGSYQENLVISKPITIQGEDASKVMLKPATAEAPTILVRDTDSVNIVRLAIWGEHLAFQALQANVILKESQIKSHKQALSLMGFKGEEITIQKSEITSSGPAVLALGQFELYLRENQIYGAPTAIVIGGNVTAHLEKNKLFRNYDGLVAGGNAQVIIKENHIFENDGTGLRVSDAATAEISQNQILSNGEWGISLWQRPCYETEQHFSGTIQGTDNEIAKNLQGDLCPQDFPWPPGFKRP